MLLMNKRAVRMLPVLAASKSLGRWIAIAWNAQRAQPSYLAEFVNLLAQALKRDYPGDEYGFAPGIEAPRSKGRGPRPPR